MPLQVLFPFAPVAFHEIQGSALLGCPRMRFGQIRLPTHLDTEWPNNQVCTDPHLLDGLGQIPANCVDLQQLVTVEVAPLTMLLTQSFTHPMLSNEINCRRVQIPRYIGQ